MYRRNIAENIAELIGNTPVMRLRLRDCSANLFLKLEKFNPGLSMKDRMALSMVRDAEKKGILKPGGTIIESSSGNTAIGLAMLSASLNYHFIAVVDHHASKLKIEMIEAYGGIIKVVGEGFAENQVAVTEREKYATELSEKIPNSIFMNQADNLANRAGYTNTLADELLSDVKKIDVLFGCIGTGGSLSGTAKKIKSVRPNVKVIAVEPKGSILFGGKARPYYQSGTGNPAGASIPKNILFDLIDDHYFASDEEAFTTCCFLAEHLGLLIGGSGGGVVLKAIEYSKSNQVNNCVVVIPDGGEKYLSTVYSKDWMTRRKLFDPKIKRYLEANVR